MFSKNKELASSVLLFLENRVKCLRGLTKFLDIVLNQIKKNNIEFQIRTHNVKHFRMKWEKWVEDKIQA